MSLYLCPIEIKQHIISYIQPLSHTSQEVKKCGRMILNLALVNKEFKNVCEQKLKDLQKIIYYMYNTYTTKYNVYNKSYNFCLKKLAFSNPKPDWLSSPQIESPLPPQLFDAVLSGCQHAKSSMKEYTEAVQEDIKEIVRLKPQSVNYTQGYLGNRNSISPLVAACLNENVPISVIEFLLQNGADPHIIYWVNEQQTTLLKDMEQSLDKNRFLEIQALLKKYGAKN